MSEPHLYTDNVPTKPGWYFVRPRWVQHGRVVQVYDADGVLMVQDAGSNERLDDFTKDMQWSPEPLVEPTGPVDEEFGFKEQEPA